MTGKQIHQRILEAAVSLNKTSAHLEEILHRQPPVCPPRPAPIPLSAPDDLRAAPAVLSTERFGEGSPRD